MATDASAQTVPPALGLGAVDSGLPSIQTFSYQFQVPPLPVNGNTGAAYEFHAGIMTGNNVTFIKGSFAYGCEIMAHTACFPPFQNRYLFYVTVLNQMLNYRTQYPASGLVVTSGSNYTVKLAFGKCDLRLQALTFTVSNETWTYSQKICPVSGTFTQAWAGLIEIHDATSCSQFPATQTAIEWNITANGYPVDSFTETNFTPPINCNFALNISGNNVSYSWNDSAID